MTNVLMMSAYFWEPPKQYYGVFWQAVHLRRRGHSVVAVSSRIHNSSEKEIIEGVHVYRVPALYFSRIPWPIAFPGFLWRLMDYLVKHYNIEIVHLQEPAFPYAFYAALYCKLKRIPFVVTAHGSYFGLGWGLIPDLILDLYVLVFGRLTFKFAQKVAVISKGQIPLLQSLGVPKERIVFTPLGVDTDKSVFRKATEEDKEEARKRLSLGREDFVVGFVGRLAPDKNVSLLIEAGKQLSREIRNLKLLIVGGGIEEPELRNKVSLLKLSDSVLFLGWRDDVDKILPAIDVFAFPSLSDGLGRAFVEAMAMGVPVVSTDVPGPTGVIVHEENGLLVERNNSNEMARAILRLYQDKSLREKLSKKGLWVRDVFCWETCISQVEAMYNEVAKTQRLL